MLRTHLAVMAAAALLSSTALAEPPHAAAPAKANAAPEAKGAGAKPEEKKADEKKADDKKVDEKKVDEKAPKGDRSARRSAEHEAQKAKLASTLKAPMDDAIKQELRRHAERIAKIERIKVVATDAKDKEAIERATKLLEKENARHDKWMANRGSKTTPATETKEGAK